MSSLSTSNAPHAIIVGAGLIGLSVAYALTERGWRATILERGAIGAGASRAAAGMLAPYAEAIEAPHAHPLLAALGRASLDLWPEWSKTIEYECGLKTGLDQTGTLIPAYDPAYEPDLARAATQVLALGGDARIVSGEDARAREASLSSHVALALDLPLDAQADPRATTAALTACLRARGVEIIPNITVDGIRSEPEPAVFAGGEPLASSWRAADAIVMCAGWRTAAIADLPGLPAITPIKGQALALRHDTGLRHTIRAPGAYLVPKSDGRLVIGATSEPGLSDSAVEDDAIRDLTAAAVRAVPQLADATIIDAWAGVRPATPDHAPLLGVLAPGVFIASGHHRNGVLLAPITGEVMADMIATNAVSELIAQFAPGRFSALSTIGPIST